MTKFRRRCLSQNMVWIKVLWVIELAWALHLCECCFGHIPSVPRVAVYPPRKYRGWTRKVILSPTFTFESPGWILNRLMSGCLASSPAQHSKHYQDFLKADCVQAKWKTTIYDCLRFLPDVRLIDFLIPEIEYKGKVSTDSIMAEEVHCPCLGFTSSYHSVWYRVAAQEMFNKRTRDRSSGTWFYQGIQVRNTQESDFYIWIPVYSFLKGVSLDPRNGISLCPNAVSSWWMGSEGYLVSTEQKLNFLMCYFCQVLPI